MHSAINPALRSINNAVRLSFLSLVRRKGPSFPHTNTIERCKCVDAAQKLASVCSMRSLWWFFHGWCCQCFLVLIDFIKVVLTYEEFPTSTAVLRVVPLELYYSYVFFYSRLTTTQMQTAMICRAYCRILIAATEASGVRGR